MTYKVKGIKNVYKFIGTEEYEIQDYDYGCVCPDFCLLWKDGKKVNKKLIKEFLKMQDDVERIDKEKKKIQTQQTKQTVQTGSGDVLKEGLKRSGKPLKVKTADNNKKINKIHFAK